MIALVTPLDAVFDGLSFGIKYLVRSFGLKVKPGGRKGFVTPCRRTTLSIMPAESILSPNRPHDGTNVMSKVTM